ncbi:MAG: hypothetical protein M1823_000360 [Watsoniomyces obsoletus]|nr:MAG: hypothetical protein M1823_000360 [Watsoniomyces obsoletus]
MIPSIILVFLAVAIADVTARSSVILPRQDNGTTGSNTFASITPSKTLEWVPCYQDSSAAKLGPVSCARLIAPLDYSDTSLGEIQLAIIKLGASESECNLTKRAVFVNRGGPGGDPVDFINDLGGLLRAQVGNGVDLVGIVPRGVGSTFPPITCDATDDIVAERQNNITASQPGYRSESPIETYEVGKALGRDCGSVTPDLIPYVGTVHVARDMDYVRQALGQDKLSYLGYSYGTVLGATYAALFPDNIDRMVLDAVVDFNSWYQTEKNAELDAGDTDLTLSNFFQFCYDAGPDNCRFWYSSPEEIRDRFFEIDQRLLANPFPISGFGSLKTPQWRSAVYQGLYRPAETFALLAGIAAEIYNGTAGPAIQAYVQLLQSSPGGEPPLVDPATGLKNSDNAGYWIQCLDGGARDEEVEPKELQKIFKKYQKETEFFAGPTSQLEILCLGARLSAKERITEKFKKIKTSHPILFVGNTADPTTPLRAAFKMSEAFPGSTVLTINGTGHISYRATQGTECAEQWIAPYFKDGTLPPRGTVCEGKQTPFE